MARGVRAASRLDTGLLVACCAISVLALLMPGRMREAVGAAIRETVLAPLVRVQHRAEIVRATVVARDSVLRVGAAATGLALGAPELATENAQLRQLIGLGARLKRGYVAAEALQTEAADREFTLTLSAGSKDGVEPFAPVVTADGLVGMVQQVDATMSIAISWAHPDFAVSAMSADESAFGIVQPHLAAGAERWLLELHGVAFRSSLKPGTLIVSTGIGKTFPRGIPVGTVIGEIQTTEKWARTYLIKPSVLPNTPGPVLLMIPSRSPKDVNGVWTTLASADSAAHAIEIASDSLARKAALDELAARRAALDSVSLDSLVADSIARSGGTGGVRPPRPDTTRRPGVRDTVRPRPRPDSIRVKPPTGPPPPDTPFDVESGAVRWP